MNDTKPKPPVVLIADNDVALTQELAVRCKAMGLNTWTVSDGLAAYQVLMSEAPDLLILDFQMPGANGLYLYEQLERDTELPPVPAIMLTGRSDSGTVERCRKLGAPYVCKGIETWHELRPLIARLLALPGAAEGGGAHPQPIEHDVLAGADSDIGAQPPRILVVDDDPAVSKALEVRLGAHGMRVLRASSAMQAFWIALKELPDAVITDYRMPDGFGSYLIGRMKTHPITRHIPILVLSGCTDRKRELLRIGACAFFSKPVDFDELRQELERRVAVSAVAR